MMWLCAGATAAIIPIVMRKVLLTKWNLVKQVAWSWFNRLSIFSTLCDSSHQVYNPRLEVSLLSKISGIDNCFRLSFLNVTYSHGNGRMPIHHP